MNILISGVHGFVGSNLVESLKTHYSIFGLDIIVKQRKGCIKTFYWKDINPESFPLQTLPKFDAIIHLAGKAHDTKNQSAAAFTELKNMNFFAEDSKKKSNIF